MLFRPTRFRLGELRHLLRTRDEFSLYEDGTAIGSLVQSAARLERVRITQQQQPVTGERHGYLMGREQFTLITVVERKVGP